MKRFLINFSYDGSGYKGFQKQNGLSTIQENMEKALKYINNGRDTKLVASGRTDAFVHANNQMAHADIYVNITEEKLKRDKVHSCSKATDTHYEVGTKVRKAIEDIGGTMPENLPTPEKSIKQVEKEQLRRLKDKKTKLMLDE